VRGILLRHESRHVSTASGQRVTRHRAALLGLLLLLPITLDARQRRRRGTPPPAKPAAAETKPTPPPAPPPPAAPIVSEAMLRAMAARSIGPAIMGGRISDVALDPENPWTFYLATAHGGLQKTTDNGGSFSNVMASQPVPSLGAVAVAPSEAKVVWAGSGEANDRNSSGWGTGVYRSTDGGANWTAAGLERTRVIARIAVHPKDPATAYAAAPGDLWNPTPDRGIYKTSDGGKSWKRVLGADPPHADEVGGGDVLLDPQNPSTVYAALYARRRTPWSFVAGPAASGGQDAGGIFKSTDGGASWKKLGPGLPPGTGRIGLALHAKNPKILYAVVQSDENGTSDIDDVTSKRGGVFRSDDGGESWSRRSGLDPRPFYFSQIRVDPVNDQKVYVLGFMLHVSEDGGRTWREDRFNRVHADCHALAIDPRHPNRLLLGTDGGVYQSYDDGAHWAHVATVPLGEYYRIALDDSRPYRICGGLQDNLNWLGPSATRSSDGITNGDWTNLHGGDGFYCVFDRSDRDVVYVESQEGKAHRFNLSSGAVKQLRPEPGEGQPAFRFHWIAPLIPSRHAKDTMYLGGNRVFALTGRGETWRILSPDLSARVPERIMTAGSGAETYGVVFALAESPVRAGLLWAGTDDGKLWVTENGGGTWNDLTDALPDEAKGQWITCIEPGGKDDGTAYLVVSAFRTGNYAPLVYRTADRGRTWQSIGGNLPREWPARVVREDPENPNLLFAGTEIGLYCSFDRGGSWTPLGKLGAVPVDDLAIHPRDRDLVVATHGRSLWIVDDVRPLALFTAEIAKKPAHIFPVAPALGFEPLPGWLDYGGTAVFRGRNPPRGALLTVWVGEFTGDPIRVAITGPDGRPVANLSAPGTPGFSRLVWDLKPTKDVLSSYGGQGQKFVRPGTYQATLTFGKLSQKETIKVDIARDLETR
jgi:photosystem II stability/assembly factor-like uncharacterized protein